MAEHTGPGSLTILYGNTGIGKTTHGIEWVDDRTDEERPREILDDDLAYAMRRVRGGIDVLLCLTVPQGVHINAIECPPRGGSNPLLDTPMSWVSSPSAAAPTLAELNTEPRPVGEADLYRQMHQERKAAAGLEVAANLQPPEDAVASLTDMGGRLLGYVTNAGEVTTYATAAEMRVAIAALGAGPLAVLLYDNAVKGEESDMELAARSDEFSRKPRAFQRGDYVMHDEIGWCRITALEVRNLGRVQTPDMAFKVVDNNGKGHTVIAANLRHATDEEKANN